KITTLLSFTMSARDAIRTYTCVLTSEELAEFLELYPVPPEYNVMLPKSTQTIYDAPDGYIGLYLHSFSLENLRLPLTKFFCEVLQYFHIHISRLNPFGCAKLTTFAVMCKAYGCEPSVELFRGFFNLFPGGKWNFMYADTDEDLSFLPKESCLDDGTGGSLQRKKLVLHTGSVAGRIKVRKCKTRGGSSRPPVKHKLVHGTSSSISAHQKTSRQIDSSFITISDDDEGLLD
ncbi:hypothetical protein Tco_1495718, partial [Tanacetum coccineum]